MNKLIDDNIEISKELVEEVFNLKSTKREQLEYIGDAVLGLAISQHLCQLYPYFGEGQLTVARSNLINRRFLAKKFHELKLESFFELGSSSEETERILGDTFEAFIGAIFLEKGFDTVSNLILKWFTQDLKNYSKIIKKDYKTELQELLQKKGLPLPVYYTIEKDMKFFSSLLIEGKIISSGIGLSKKTAEQEAACQAFSILKSKLS